jgi:glycerophosphoryl diester phosphodiesterase
LQAYVWTVDDPARGRELADFGVDGITTNDPVVMRAALEKK